MKISHFVNIFMIFCLIFLVSFSCTTMKVEIPKGSTEAEQDISVSTSSEIQGDYLLTSWQESKDENFKIDFKTPGKTKILEVVSGALGLKRYDNLAFVANDKEIIGYIPALGILEYKKNQEEFDMSNMDDFLDKSWREVLRITFEDEIRMINALRIPSTKTVALFIACENGNLHKIVISDASTFLNVSDFGVKSFESGESVKVTTIENDRINAILPVFSKESVFVLLFSGTMVKINLNTLEIEQTFTDILWNGYSLTTQDGESGQFLIASGRHPMNPIIIYTWNELNEFKELRRLSPKEYKTPKGIYGNDNLLINADGKMYVTKPDFSDVRKVNQYFGENICCVDFSEDLERIFVSTDEGALILGAKIENEDFMLTNKILKLTDFLSFADSKDMLFGKFLNSSYMLLVSGTEGKLIRTKYDKQIEGTYEIWPSDGSATAEANTPDYRDIETYKELLERIEQLGDWEAMKQVYNSINKDFKPSGSYFPGYAGTALRGGWIEDTLVDQISDREKIAALIMMYWNKESSDLLLASTFKLLREESLPVPDYLFKKQPLLSLHRAYILHSKDPQTIVSIYSEFLKLWGESFEKAKKDFKNLGISKEQILEMKMLLLNFGFELYDLLPAPVRDYHKQLINTIRGSDFLSDIENLETLITDKMNSYQAKWSSGK